MKRLNQNMPIAKFSLIKKLTPNKSLFSLVSNSNFQRSGFINKTVNAFFLKLQSSGRRGLNNHQMHDLKRHRFRN